MYLFYSIFFTQLSLFLYFLVKLYRINITKFSLNNFFVIIFPFCLLLTSGYRFIGYSIYDDLYLIVITILGFSYYKNILKNINFADSLVVFLFSIFILQTIVGFVKFHDLKLIVNLLYFIGLLFIYFFLKHNKYLLINIENIKIYYQILITYFLLLNISAIALTVASHYSYNFYSTFAGNEKCGPYLFWKYSTYAHQCFQNVLTSGSTLALMPIVFAFLLINFHFPKYYKHTIILNVSIFLFISIYASEFGYLYVLIFSILILLTTNNKIQYISNIIISIILAISISTLLYASFNYIFITSHSSKVTSTNEFVDKESGLLFKWRDTKFFTSVNDTVLNEAANYDFFLKYIDQSSIKDDDLETSKNKDKVISNKIITKFTDPSFKEAFRNRFLYDPEILNILNSIDLNLNQLRNYNPVILNSISNLINDKQLNTENPILPEISNFEFQAFDLNVFGLDSVYETYTGTIASRLRDIILLFDERINFTDLLIGKGTKSSNYDFPELYKFSDLNLILFYGQEILQFSLEGSLKKHHQLGYVIHDFGRNYLLMSIPMSFKENSPNSILDNKPYSKTILYFPKFIYEFGLISFLIFLIIFIINIKTIFKTFKIKDSVFVVFSMSSVCLWSLLTDLTNNFVFYSVLFFPYILEILAAKNSTNKNT